METTINPKEMYTEEEFLSRISYLNRLIGKLTPEQRNVTKQFMAENDMAAVGELLDYLQESLTPTIKAGKLQ